MTQPEHVPEFFNLPASPIEAAERNRLMVAAEMARGDLAKAWEAGWRTGAVYGYWAQREDVSDAADIDLRANPYGTSVPQKGSK